MPRMSSQVLGNFKTGMDRSSKRGGKDGAQRLYTLQNAYINERGDVIPRPGLQHVADVTNSAGLYGWQGQLHVFHGDDDFVDPGNPLVKGHLLRYPLTTLSLLGDVPNGQIGDVVSGAYTNTHSESAMTYAVTAGALPPGLSLASDGNYSGTYTTPGSYSWTVTGTLDQFTVTVDDSAVVEVQKAQLTDWRYLTTTLADATDYSGTAFDDSAWTVGAAPFGYKGPSSVDIGALAHAYDSRFKSSVSTTVPLDGSVWLRRHLPLASVPAGGFRLIGYFDNAYLLYVNGVLVSNGSTITNAGVNTTISSSAFVVGDNVIAIRCNDDAAHPSYDASYFDFLLDLA